MPTIEQINNMESELREANRMLVNKNLELKRERARHGVCIRLHGQIQVRVTQLEEAGRKVLDNWNTHYDNLLGFESFHRTLSQFEITLAKGAAMTAQTDPTDQIADRNRVLAEATKECPFTEPHRSQVHRLVSGKKLDCKDNRVARFPGFRQECGSCNGSGEMLVGGRSGGGHVNPVGTTACLVCNGTGWQVALAGLEAALAGLRKGQALSFYAHLIGTWVDMESLEGLEGPMPSAPEILAKGLELVIEIAGLELHCQAGKDGDCIWKDCPQLGDNEPSKSGRRCPLDTEVDDEY